MSKRKIKTTEHNAKAGNHTSRRVARKAAKRRGEAAVSLAAKRIAAQVMRPLTKIHKQLLKRHDWLWRAFPETENAIHEYLTQIIDEAITGAPKREHVARARAALATSAQYVDRLLPAPEFVSARTVDRIVEGAARIQTKKKLAGPVGPDLTRAEVGHLLLAASATLFVKAVPGGGKVSTIETSKVASPATAAHVQTLLREMAELIRIQQPDPGSLALGTALVDELQPLWTVFDFLRKRMDAVRAATHPLSNSTSWAISPPRQYAARLEPVLWYRLGEYDDSSPVRPDISDDITTVLVDTFSDLLHLIGSFGHEPREILDRAQSNYEVERYDKPPMFWQVWYEAAAKKTSKRAS